MSPSRGAQLRAADPAGSAWVAANAGSGKTRVLTERVARLLLEGAPPARILCLTYTKAAAAEMRSRLFGMLGDWAMMDDAALAEALAALTGAAAPEDLDRARRLFAEALETPGGLKIQTIHAFCDALLRRFPLEAGAPPGFRTMDDREQRTLIARLLDEMAGGPALAGMAALIGEDALDNVAKQVIGKRALFSGPAGEAEIAAAFGAQAPLDDAAARVAALEALDGDRLRALIAAYAKGSAPEQDKAVALGAALEVKGAALAEEVEKKFLTSTGAPRKMSGLSTKNSRAAEPDWEAHAEHLIQIALEVREAGLAAKAADRACRLRRFGRDLIDRYELAKQAAGTLDFDDLVNKARALLTRSDMADWALYRLDGGIDHILVDEAQDTSPAQWDVITAIARALWEGEGARRVHRTVFVVGDEKQSIYSFQGAAPGEFERMRAHYANRFEEAENPMREEALIASFRSAPAILQAVDAVFAGDAAAGLSARAEVAHVAHHDARVGRVELWPLLEPEETPEDPEPWAPVDMPARREPRLRLAEAVAAFVAELTSGAILPPGGGAPVRPGDVIILLQKRNPMMAPLIRGLKRREVPVAGADRLTLREELAVKDLLALLRVAATPTDDLSLAAVLRSPLCNLSEEDLFDLAHGREVSLNRALAASGRWAREAALVKACADDADFLRPYELLEKILLVHDGRRRLIARLGREAEDPIDELLAQALIYETAETPSLEGFLAWMARGEDQIKRELEGGRGEVRVMSAHGAKGLEAPVVILPDTLRAPAEDDAREVLAEIATEAGPAAAWRTPADETPRLLADAKLRARAEQAAEHKRLLYVAMTRAEDWLIIAGAKGGKKGDVAQTWYGLAEAGLERLGARSEAAPAGLEGARLVWETGDTQRPLREQAAAASPPAPPADWLSAPPPAEPAARERKAASMLGHEEDEAAAGLGRGRERALARGVAVHAALEDGATDLARLTAVAALAAPELDAEIIAGAAAEALAARNLPEAAAFFEPDALAEAGVALQTDGALVIGRIDRLVATDELVAFVDFKSDARPPDSVAETPAAYLAQLAAYRTALSAIYPGRAVEAHILWSAAPRLDRIPDAALDAAAAPRGA